MRKTSAQITSLVVVCMDTLESRQFLSVSPSGAPWGAQAVQIGQDLAVANYPQITGAGQTIAIIDTGTGYRHPVLGAGIGPGLKVVDGFDFMNWVSDPSPKDGVIPHGTASAGLAAGYGWNFDGSYFQGIAPGAQIVALRAYQASVVPALDWVIAHRQQYNITAVQVLGPDAGLEQNQINMLVDAGVFVGTSGGNGGADKAIPKLAGVVRTGSVDPANNLSWFTQRGARLAMLAPGEHVSVPFESGDGQEIELFSDGTSWASPQVVGAAALIKQVNPAFNEAQILSILQDSGTKIYDPVSKLTYSELNVNNAIALAISRSQPVSSVPPVPPVPTAPKHGKSGKTIAARGGTTPTPTPTPPKGKSGKTLAARAAAEAAAAKQVTPSVAVPVAAGKSGKTLAARAAAAIAVKVVTLPATFSQTNIVLQDDANGDDVLT